MAPAAEPESPDEVVAEAPGRVNLIGDHTDHDGGLALPFALPWRTRVHARRRSDGLISAVSAAESGRVQLRPPGEPGEVDGWGRYVAGVVWALAESGVAAPGADLTIDSEVPVGAGLSSSHALQVAVASALLALAGDSVPVERLAEIVQTAENGYAGVPSGLMDQLAILSGRECHLVLVDAGGARGERTALVPCDPAADGLAFLVVDTGVAHALDDGAYAAIRGDVETAAAALGAATLRRLGDDVGLEEALARVSGAGLGDDVARRARHVLSENARVRQAVALCRAGALRELGPLLSASHTSMRDDLRNSDPVVDATVQVLEDAGALGARMTGGGFGGSVVALVEEPQAEGIIEAVRRAYASMGRDAPLCARVEPSAGSRLISPPGPARP